MRRNSLTHAPHRRLRKIGFSVVELIVALAIFTFGISAVYEHYIGLNRQGGDQVYRVQARLLAHQELNKLLVLSPAQLAAWVPPTGPVPVKEDIAFYADYQLARQSTGPIEITVRVWRARETNSTPPQDSAVARGVKVP